MKVSVRHLPNGVRATSFRPRGAQPRRHVGLGPGLVDEDEAPGIKPPLIPLPPFAPARDLRPQLLDGEQFLHVTPASRTIRHTDP